MNKVKTVTFNIFRPSINEYKGVNLISSRAFDFNNLIHYINETDEYFSTLYNGEEIGIYNIRMENLDEGLSHIRIIKFRQFEVPNIYTRLKSRDIYNKEDLFKEVFDEEEIKLNESSIGETLSILYDGYNNILVIQSNQHCTSLKGIVTLLDSIFANYIEKNSELNFEHTIKESDLMFSLSPVMKKMNVEDIDKFEVITEFEFSYEDNNMSDNVAEILGCNNELNAGKVETRYYIDTNGKNKKREGLKRSSLSKIASLFRKRENNFKKFNVKGRFNSNSNIEMLEFVNSRLHFNHKFPLNVENATLDHHAIYYEMENKYLGNNGMEGYREKANY